MQFQFRYYYTICRFVKHCHRQRVGQAISVPWCWKTIEVKTFHTKILFCIF
jgi:hypothetical protein